MANFGMFLSVLIPIAVLGIVVFFVMAIVAEAKTASKGSAVRSAFSYVVSLVMLFMMVASSAFLLQQGLRAWVFTKAESTSFNSGPPPTFYVTATSEKLDANTAALGCKDTCQLTDADKQNFATWKQSYADWKKENETPAGKFSVNQKRDMVNAFSFLIVALPIFWWFFIRTIQREVRAQRKEGHGKASPLRATYYYLVAFTGLIGVVVSVAFLVNLGLKRVTGIQSTSSTRSIPAAVGPSFEQNGIRSIVNCADKCGISAEDKALAEQWLVDYDAWQKKNVSSFPAQNSIQTDLANILPILLVSLPLFLYHFIAVRRESAEDAPSQPSAPGTTA